MPKISVPPPLTGGTSGFALAKGSNADYDLTWTSSIGGGLLPAQAPGYWYENRIAGAALSNTFNPSASLTYWVPMYLNTARTIVGLGYLRSSTVNGAAGIVAVATCTSTGLPGSLLYSGSVTPGTASTVTRAVSVPTPQGWFYIGIQYTLGGLTPYVSNSYRQPPFSSWPTSGPTTGGSYTTLTSTGAPSANPLVTFVSMAQPHAAYLL